MLKLGTKNPRRSAGPDSDIVGFTTLCPHQGYPLSFNASDKTLNCPGHYSRFDCENGGQQIWDTRPPARRRKSKKFAFLINNGRANHVWQSAYLDQREDLVMDRWPYPYIQMNPADMKDLGLSAGDLVEVYNDNGATQAMAYPTPTARRKQTFMLFAFPTGVQGNVVSPGVNELIIPNYKQTWGDIRKIASAPGAARQTSFKSWEYQA